MFVIFGGTAAYHVQLDKFASVSERRVLETPYGPSAAFVHLTAADGHQVWFSSRHGEGGLQRSAGFVNHRANVWAARELGGAEAAILSWNGVGAIAPGLSVGQCIVPDDVLDMTRARVASFHPTPSRNPEQPHPQPLPGRFAYGEGRVMLPSGSPFDADLRGRLVKTCAALGLICATHGTYVCTEGPRLETAAEIALFGWGGAAVVGMTLAPEVWLAAELGVRYASLCVITNMATGRWHLDPRRDFGVGVGETGLRVTLAAAT